jgi:hypothetical protein
MTTMSLGLSRDDRPILIAALFILVILVAGTTYTIARFGSAPLLSPTYLLQQLQIGSFLGIVAAGMMIVILIAQIDLSVPWTLAAAAMMATSIGGPLAIPVGLGIGLLVGLINGIGVAYLRVPSMIFTLGVNAVMRGLMVAHTGGYAPQTTATELMQTLASERTLGIPNALFVWAAVSVLVVVILQRHRQQRGGGLSGWRQYAPRHRHLLRALRSRGRSRGRAARRLFHQGLSGDGRRLSAAFDRSGRDRGHKHPGRSRPLSRHAGRRGADRAAQQRALDHGNARGRPAGDLRPRHHPDAARLWTRRTRDELVYN